VKDLSTITKITSEAIMNFSSVIKDNLVKSHEQFQQVTRDLLWPNITLHEQNTLYSTIKQMEITLAQVTEQIDDLFDAVQYAIQGRLPIKVINPVALQNILRNVTLKLPDGYELIPGTNLDTVHLYYDLVRVSVVANIHHINLILSVLLKPSNCYFTLCRIITLAVHISSDRFAQYSIDYTYISLQHSQQCYILLTEADL
jgi:hypothetical protein